MSNEQATIFCRKLNKHADKLPAAPYPGELGQKIFDYISQPAWEMWLEQQTMLINEYRLNLLDAEAKDFLAKQMEIFLFENSISEQQATK